MLMRLERVSAAFYKERIFCVGIRTDEEDGRRCVSLLADGYELIFDGRSPRCGECWLAIGLGQWAPANTPMAMAFRNVAWRKGNKIADGFRARPHPRCAANRCCPKNEFADTTNKAGIRTRSSRRLTLPPITNRVIVAWMWCCRIETAKCLQRRRHTPEAQASTERASTSHQP